MKEEILQALNKRNLEKLKALLNKVTEIRLSPYLTHYSSSKSLELSDKKIQLLAKSLETNRTLTVLDLEYNYFGYKSFGVRKNDLGAQALSTMLTQNNTLYSLNLGYNWLDNSGTQVLSKGLMKNRTLTILNLRYNNIGDSGAEALSMLLVQNETLLELYLAKNRIGGSGARALSEALMQNKTLAVLDLVENMISYFGGKVLSEALMQNKTLTYLAISIVGGSQQIINAFTTRNEILHAARKRNIVKINQLLGSCDITHVIDDQGNTIYHLLLQKKDLINPLYLHWAIHLNTIKSIKNEKNQTPLDIARQSENQQLIQLVNLPLEKINFTQAWKTWRKRRLKNVDVLDLSYSNLTLENIILLQKILILVPIITQLNLSFNNLQDKDSEQTLKLIKNNPTLKYIWLSNNLFNNKFGIDLAQAIENHQSLETMDLSHNFINYEGANALIKTTQSNKLKHLNLSHNIISIDEYELNNLIIATKKSKCHIDLSQNNIGCTARLTDELLKQKKPREKPTKKLLQANLLSSHGLFISDNQREVPSHLQPTLKISREKWVIALARKKGIGEEHAMLFIEGMRSFGQLFLQKADFGPERGLSDSSKNKVISGKGRVHTKLYDIDDFVKDYDNYIMECWVVDRNPDIKGLQRKILEEEKNQAPYYFKLDSALFKLLRLCTKDEETYNCFTWAKSKLALVNIKVDQRWTDQWFPNTSRILKAQAQEKQKQVKCLIQ